MREIVNEYGRAIVAVVVASLIIGIFGYGATGGQQGWINQSLGELFTNTDAFMGDAIGLNCGQFGA